METYIVLDLEMCRVQKIYRQRGFFKAHEIIQIGAVKMNKNFEIIDTFCVNVKPEYGKIDGFIKNLTGIGDSDVKAGLLLKDALMKFTKWIGDTDAVFFEWSDSDYAQLHFEIFQKDIDFSGLELLMRPHRWIDYQNVFGRRFQFIKSVALKNALDYVDIDLQGRAHNGLDDAYNTALLIQKLEWDHDYKLDSYWDYARGEQQEHLSFTLADLIPALNM